MRVTEKTNFDSIRNSISSTKGRMERLQEQNATLKKINTPSDNPVGAARLLEIRTDKVNNEQFQSNARLADTFLNNTEFALGELSDVVLRVKEIALGQASGASSSNETRLGVAEEVTQLYNQAVATANRRIGDRYLFGGFRTDKPPVNPDGQYLGDNGQMMVEIARDVYLATNTPGIEAFNTKPKVSADKTSSKEYPEMVEKPGASPAPRSSRERERDGIASRAPAALPGTGEAPVEQNVNLFDELQALRISLLTGDLDGIRATLENFDQLHAKLTAERAKIGSRMQGLQSTAQALERHDTIHANLSSQLEDADLAQVMTDLAKEETIFKSVLAGSQKLVQPTLLDFLK